MALTPEKIAAFNKITGNNITPQGTAPVPTRAEQIQKIANKSSINQMEDNRNIVQKAAGFIVDPIAKLGTETGNLIGKGILKGANAISGGAIDKYTPEGNLDKALARAGSTPSQVPGLGTPVKGINDVTGRDVAGQVLETGAMFAPGAGKGASVLGKVAAGAGTGYAMDVAQGLQNEDKTLGEAATPGLGTVIGGSMPIAGAIMKNLPTWFVKKALPKMNPENAEFALKNLDYGTVKTNIIHSDKALKVSKTAIDNILNHPEYADEVGDITSIIPSVTEKMPNSGLTDKSIFGIIKSLAPKNATLVKKLEEGTATIAEQNLLRSELDRAIYPSIGDKINPKLSFNKSVGKIVTDALRNNVQDTAKETVPLFEKFSKEIDLNNALKFAKAKVDKGAPVGLYDILAGIGGGAAGIVGERAARTPAVLTNVAKGVNAVNTSKITQNAGKVVKKPIIKAASKASQ